MKTYLSLVKGQQQVRGPREDAPGAINEVIPSRDRVRIGFQHAGSLHQLSARVLHSVSRRSGFISEHRKKSSGRRQKTLIHSHLKQGNWHFAFLYILYLLMFFLGGTRRQHRVCASLAKLSSNKNANIWLLGAMQSLNVGATKLQVQAFGTGSYMPPA